MVTFVPLQEAGFVPGEKRSESPGWRWRQRGGVCVKEGGIIATSFTIYTQEEEENGPGGILF